MPEGKAGERVAGDVGEDALSGGGTGQGESAQELAQGLGMWRNGRSPPIPIKPVVAAQQFIRPFAGEDDFEARFTARLVEQVDGQAGGGALRLFELAHDSRQQVERFWAEMEGVVLAANALGHRLGVGGFVVAGGAEGDVEGVNRLAAEFGEQGCQSAGVDAAAGSREPTGTSLMRQALTASRRWAMNSSTASASLIWR